MYFPYLYGQKFELIALRKLAGKLAVKKKVLPLIDPVTSKIADLTRTLSVLEQHHLPYLLVVNPDTGAFDADNKETASWFSELESNVLPHASQVIPVFKITSKTVPADVKCFLSKHKARRVGLLHKAELVKCPEMPDEGIHIFSAAHTSSPYQQQFSGFRVLLRDGFNKQSKNALYPTAEHYDDLNLTYHKLNFSGFGDFTITGDHFSTGGGEAYAVAIHLTRANPDHGALQMLHFVSDTVTVPPRDNALKYSQAVRKLAELVNRRKAEFKHSDAVQVFVHEAKTFEFHGLGEVKGRSIQHHIETVENVL